MTDPNDKALAELRQQLRLRDREIGIANAENDALRKEVATLKREREAGAVAAGLPPVRNAISLDGLPAHVVSTIEALVENHRGKPERPYVGKRPTDEPAAAPPMRGFRLPNGRAQGEPKVIKLLRAIGKPASVGEIAALGGLQNPGVYQAVARYSHLLDVHHGRPTRYSIRAPKA